MFRANISTTAGHKEFLSHLPPQVRQQEKECCTELPGVCETQLKPAIHV